MQHNEDYRAAYQQHINNPTSGYDEEINTIKDYNEEGLYNTEPSIHEYNTHLPQQNTFKDDYHENHYSTGQDEYEEQHHNIHNPGSSYGSIENLHSHSEEGFGPDFTKDFFESTHLDKGFFDENFPGNLPNSENFLPDSPVKFKGKRQTKPFPGSNPPQYQNSNNLSNPPIRRPIRNNLPLLRPNLNQIVNNNNQLAGHRFPQNTGQQGIDYQDTPAVDYGKQIIISLIQIITT